MVKIPRFLEDKANQFRECFDKDSWDISIPSMIKREIVLTMEQINRLQKLHVYQLNKLLQAECYIDSEIMQMEQRISRYSPARFPEREKMHRNLLNIGAERRRLAANLEEKVRSLEDRLLSLINKHEQINLDDEHRKDSRKT